MKKLLTLLMALTLLFSVAGAATASGEEPGASPTIKKPVHVSITDELGTPVSGASVQVLDTEGQLVDSFTSSGDGNTVFLPEGQYTLKLVSVPGNYLIEEDEVSITVTVKEAERLENLVGECHYDHSHPNICSKESHIGLETYTVHDSEGSVTAYCFNQNYDNPDSSSRYKRLVGSPELLYSLAQNKNGSVGPQALYDHVLAIIYHSGAVQAKYGLDNIVANYLTNMAIKNFTDPACFISFDDDGNSMLARDEDGNIIRDEDGNYVFNPGGTVLGSMVNHARQDNKEDVFPQEYRDAYHELIAYTYHPSDYYLYIYYPDNFQGGNTDTYQCLMSVFQVEPVRTSFSVRTATTMEITKAWDDGENQDGLRPSPEVFAAGIHLQADGSDVTESYRELLTVTDNGDNTYTASFTGLPKLNDSLEEIAYLISEEAVPGYTADKTSAANGETITNRHPPELTQIEVTKTWDDGNDADGLRPTEVTITLLADDAPIRTETLNVEGQWSYTFPDLPVYKEGRKIVYRVDEEPVPDYETEIEGFVITNRHKPETTEIQISKVWDDNNNQDGLRPKSVTVNLLADGDIVQTKSVTPDENGNWSYTFVDLPKYRDHRTEIAYTVTENPVAEYETTIDGFTITNRHVPAVIKIPVTKMWSDSNNKAGKRPSSITIHLLADGKQIQTVKITPDANGNWSCLFENLPKYANGKEIKYTITEDPVPGYYTSINGFVVRNSTTPITGDLSHPGVWISLLGACMLALGALFLFARGRRTAR